MYLPVKFADMCILHSLMGPEKQFSGLVGNQFIPDIIFILKIEVKKSPWQPRPDLQYLKL